MGAKNLHAQIDTEFWFVAPEVVQGHSDRPIMFRIASFASATTVIISQPANASFSPIVVNLLPNSVQSVDLTARITDIENIPRATTLNKGIKITATNPISIYYEVLATGSGTNNFPLNPEIFSLKGKNALGNEFIIPSQNFCYNAYNSAESADIVATQDNTQITFTPSVECFGSSGNYQPNNTYTITLNQGQTFSLAPTSGNESFSLRGTIISSNKPIAVTVTDDSINRDGSQDLIGDQLFPVANCGNEYIVVRGMDMANQDRVYIVGTQNNTALSINGVNVATIQRGQTYDYNNLITLASYIQADKPIYVMHLSGHLQTIGNQTKIESSSSFLPKLGCTGTTAVNLFKNTADDFMLFVVTRAGKEGGFTINGDNSLLTSSDFSFVPGTSNQWVFARKSFSNTILPVNQSHSIVNNLGGFHLGMFAAYRNSVGNAVGSNYAYFSDFGQLSFSLGADKTICQGQSVTLDAGAGRDSYLWSNGANTRTITVTTAGIYSVTITQNGCNSTAQINVNVTPAPMATIQNLATQYCSQASPITLTGTPAGGTFTINGTPATSFNPATLGVGTHVVVYTLNNSNGCVSTATQNVTIGGNVSLTNNLNTSYCTNNPNITITGTAGSIFTLNGNPITTFSPSTLGVGNYTIIQTYNDGLGCTGTLEKIITINNLPTLNFTNLQSQYCISTTSFILQANPLGGTFSINGNNTNELNPALLGVGNHQVIYNFTAVNGCTNSISQNVTIHNLPTNLSNNLNDKYCINSPDVNISGTAGSIFTLNGNPITIFSPSTLGVGNYTITQTLTDANNCAGSISKTIFVNALPNASIVNLNNNYCTNVPDFNLSGHGIPIGGTFTINGNNENIFSPATLGAGSHTVIYSYTDNNFCTNTAVRVINVVSSPILTHNLQNNYCVNTSNINLTGTMGSTFTLNGNPITTFSPSTLGAGNYVITQFANSSPCVSTQNINVQVNNLPTLTFNNLQNSYCNNASSFTLSATPAGGTFTINGISANIFNPSILGLGQHTIVYQFTDNNGCSNSISKNVTISQGETLFNNLQANYCFDANPITLTGNAGSIFTFNGNPITVFSPVVLGAGNHTIIQTLNNNGCTNTSSTQVNIYPPTNLNFTNVANQYCIDTPVFDVIPNILGGEIKIDGIITNVFNPADYVVGDVVLVEYRLVDNNGCERQISKNVRIVNCQEGKNLFLPSAFSPNGDGLNDVWEIYGDENLKNLEIKVFNRWGEVIFVTYSKNNKWDGTNFGMPLPVGTYIWKAKYETSEKKVEMKGYVAILK